jgi:hypothetical protein
MLPSWLRALLRRFKQQKIKRAIRNPAPSTDPTTMPAMAPPDNPLFAPGSIDGLVVVEAVADGNDVVKVRVGVMEGKMTPAHRFLMSEL